VDTERNNERFAENAPEQSSHYQEQGSSADPTEDGEDPVGPCRAGEATEKDKERHENDSSRSGAVGTPVVYSRWCL
jgi:hypothetical protein